MEANPRPRPLCIEVPFYVGAWWVEPRLNRITAPNTDTPIQVEPRIMEVLVALAAQPSEVVTRTQLHEQVWPDLVVSEKALTRTISVLRKVFGDDPRTPHVIATISKTGYRLLAPVSYTSPAETSTSPSTLVPSKRWSAAYLWGVAVFIAAVSSLLTWAFLRAEPTPSPLIAHPFTTFAGHETDPQLSPDGQTVAFAWEGPSGDNWDIYLKRLGMELPLRLTHHAARDRHPAWSPDGTQLAFIRQDGTTCTIMTVSALAGPERRLTSCSGFPDRTRIPPTFKAAWSPDGTSLAHEDAPTDEETSSIYLFSLETETRTRLTHPAPSFLGDTYPMFSPDGTQLSFIRYRDWGQADIHVVSLADGTERPLTSQHRIVLGHSWTSDSKSIVFSANQHGTFQLWETPATGGTPTWMPLPGNNLESLTIQGPRLVYENWLYDVNVWRLRLREDFVSEKHVASSLWDVDPAYASDGRIAFVSNRSGHYEVWISQADGTKPFQLTQLQGPMVRAPRWSPDNTRLVFEVRHAEHADLYAIDVEGGPLHPLTQNLADDVAPAWSPDGQWLYFGSNRENDWRIWKTSAMGGQTMPLTYTEGYAPQVSYDGTYVYYAKNDEPGLWRIPAHGGSATPVLNTLAPGDWGNWILSESGIYFVRRTPHPRQTFLAYYDFATESIVDLSRFTRPPPRYQQGLALSPDGQWLLHAQLDQTQSDLMLVEGFR